jgi:hypothetical protein
VKDLYKENYKPLKKEIEEDNRRWKDFSYSWIGKLNIVKLAILPKVICIFNATDIKIPMAFITEIKKSALKIIGNHKRLGIAKTILSRKSYAENITIPNLKLFYKAIAIKTAQYWHRNRYEDQWNRIEDPYMNPPRYAHLILTKVPKHTMEKRQPLLQVLLGKLVICLQKLKLNLCFSPYVSIKSKWIKNLNIRPETLKLVQERTGKITINRDEH